MYHEVLEPKEVPAVIMPDCVVRDGSSWWSLGLTIFAPFFLCLAPGLAAEQSGMTSPAGSSCETLCAALAKEIEALKPEYPQLEAFSAVKAVSGCSISYDHKTHQAAQRGGWTAGFPEPNSDGIAFYINLYDRPEQAGQADTQPVMPPWRIGKYKVTFLLLDGDKVPTVRTPIHNRLRLLGMGTEGQPDKYGTITSKKVLEATLGREVLVWGMAADAKLGAVVQIPGQLPIYVQGLQAWPKNLAGENVLALGVLSRANLPQAQRAGPGQVVSQGIDVQPYQLSNCRYRAAH